MAEPISVDDLVSVQFGALHFNRTTNTYDTTVTLRNDSPTRPVFPPLRLAVVGLQPATVSVATANGRTSTGLP